MTVSNNHGMWQFKTGIDKIGSRLDGDKRFENACHHNWTPDGNYYNYSSVGEKKIGGGSTSNIN